MNDLKQAYIKLLNNRLKCIDNNVNDGIGEG
jgi:hypothetical protein